MKSRLRRHPHSRGATATRAWFMGCPIVEPFAGSDAGSSNRVLAPFTLKLAPSVLRYLGPSNAVESCGIFVDWVSVAYAGPLPSHPRSPPRSTDTSILYSHRSYSSSGVHPSIVAVFTGRPEGSLLGVPSNIPTLFHEDVLRSRTQVDH